MFIKVEMEMSFSEFCQNMVMSKASGVKAITTLGRVWIVCLPGQFGQK